MHSTMVKLIAQEKTNKLHKRVFVYLTADKGWAGGNRQLIVFQIIVEAFAPPFPWALSPVYAPLSTRAVCSFHGKIKRYVQLAIFCKGKKIEHIRAVFIRNYFQSRLFNECGTCSVFRGGEEVFAQYSSTLCCGGPVNKADLQSHYEI